MTAALEGERPRPRAARLQASRRYRRNGQLGILIWSN